MLRAGGFEDRFSAVAEGYARHRPTYPPELFAWLAGLPTHRRRAWDCATGNGQAAVALAEYFPAVWASDASAEQLAAAPPHPRVTYARALAENSGLASGAADLVSVAQALHWFHLQPFWREVRRVLAPGGVVAVWTYDLFRCTPQVDRVVRRLYHDVVGPYWSPRREVVAGRYRALAPSFEAALERIPTPDFEMAAEWDLARLRGYLGTWSASRGWSEDHGGADPRELVDEELAAAWGEAERRRTLRWTLTVLAGR